MAKKTISELRNSIAEILHEAKKAKKSSRKSSRRPPQVEAFGYYDKEHDFSEPQGVHNLYRQQGQVNYGPQTGGTPELANRGANNPNAPSAANQMKEGDEKALRALVREVIQNGLIDEQSAWAPFTKKQEPIFESTWEEVSYLTEKAWYDRKDPDCETPKGNEAGSKPKGFEKTSFGNVKKHGQEKKDKR